MCFNSCKRPIKKENIDVDIVIYSELFKTAENIGINATIGAFTKAYSNYKIWYTYVGDIFVIQSNTQKVQFLMDAKDYIEKKRLFTPPNKLF